MRFLALVAEGFVRAYRSPGFAIEDNGEEWLIKTLAAKLPKKATVFDVGFNKGEWSAYVHKYAPHADIYAFEIAASTYAAIPQENKQIPRRLEHFGLGAKKGVISIYVNPRFSGRTSGARQPDATFKEERARIERGDAYCERIGITHIHLLKIDVEGAEGDVLRGFQRMLEKGAIDVIQFEYSYTAINTKMLLLDFYELLGSDYRIGKLYNGYVEFKEYERTDEDFLGPNIVAVRKKSAFAHLLR